MPASKSVSAASCCLPSRTWRGQEVATARCPLGFESIIIGAVSLHPLFRLGGGQPQAQAPCCKPQVPLAAAMRDEQSLQPLEVSWRPCKGKHVYSQVRQPGQTRIFAHGTWGPAPCGHSAARRHRPLSCCGPCLPGGCRGAARRRVARSAARSSAAASGATQRRAAGG